MRYKIEITCNLVPDGAVAPVRNQQDASLTASMMGRV